jgi:hypothetical protein
MALINKASEDAAFKKEKRWYKKQLSVASFLDAYNTRPQLFYKSISECGHIKVTSTRPSRDLNIWQFPSSCLIGFFPKVAASLSLPPARDT